MNANHSGLRDLQAEQAIADERAIANERKPRRPDYPPSNYPRPVLPPFEQEPLTDAQPHTAAGPKEPKRPFRCLRMTACVTIEIPLAPTADRKQIEDDVLAVLADVVAPRIPFLQGMSLAHSMVFEMDFSEQAMAINEALQITGHDQGSSHDQESGHAGRSAVPPTADRDAPYPDPRPAV